MKKRHALIVLTLAGLSICGCGNSGSDPAPPRNRPTPQAAPAAEQPAAEQPAAEPAAPAGPMREIRGTGKTGTEETVTLQLHIDATNRVTGEFQHGDLQLDVAGVLDGEVLRCWMSQAAGDAWRGTLVARGTESFSGVFAMSNSGAAASVSGNWQSQ